MLKASRNQEQNDSLASRRVLKIIAGAAVAILCLVGGFFLTRNPGDPRPWCHSEITSCLEQWQITNGQTHVYPNVGGSETQSIAAFAAYIQDGRFLQRDYGYIPGLRDDDAGDFVLMYMRKRTRYVWHGDSKTIFSPKLWLILTTRGQSIHDFPEGGLLVNTEELKRRVNATLDHIKSNNRPNWEVIVREHQEFLRTLPER